MLVCVRTWVRRVLRVRRPSEVSEAHRCVAGMGCGSSTANAGEPPVKVEPEPEPAAPEPEPEPAAAEPEAAAEAAPEATDERQAAFENLLNELSENVTRPRRLDRASSSHGG